MRVLYILSSLDLQGPVGNGTMNGTIPFTPFPGLVIVARLKLVVLEATADEVGPRPVLFVCAAPLLSCSATVDLFLVTPTATPTITRTPANTATIAIARPYPGVDFDFVPSFG